MNNNTFLSKAKNNSLYIILFLFVALFFFYYLNISVDKLPLMDYWKGSKEYLERIMTDKIRLEYIMSIPHGLHWNPFHCLIDYIFVRVFKCDNRAYIYSGMIISYCIIALVMLIYKKYFKVDNKWINCIGLLVCILPIINLNQWEILTLFCNFPFMVRILLYLLTFYIIDKLLRNKEKQVTYRESVCVGLASILIILFFSQAYFPGYVSAVIFAMVVMQFNNKENISKHAIICFCHIIGVIITMMTLEQSQVTISTSGGVVDLLEQYFMGLLIMLGATVVPTSRQVNDMTECYAIGAVILMLTCIAIILFFAKKLYQKTCFPIMCLVYAFVSIIIIIAGRANTFGLESVGSSRYVVETTIGLMGLVQIYWMVLVGTGKRLERIFSVVAVITVSCLLIWTNGIELRTGPYRKLYDQNMIALALNIEEATDEELAIFQAPAQDVRDGIQTMKKYHLSLWSE